jgi:hypothetical protein
VQRRPGETDAEWAARQFDLEQRVETALGQPVAERGKASKATTRMPISLLGRPLAPFSDQLADRRAIQDMLAAQGETLRNPALETQVPSEDDTSGEYFSNRGQNQSYDDWIKFLGGIGQAAGHPNPPDAERGAWRDWAVRTGASPGLMNAPMPDYAKGAVEMGMPPEQYRLYLARKNDPSRLPAKMFLDGLSADEEKRLRGLISDEFRWTRVGKLSDAFWGKQNPTEYLPIRKAREGIEAEDPKFKAAVERKKWGTKAIQLGTGYLNPALRMPGIAQLKNKVIDKALRQGVDEKRIQDYVLNELASQALESPRRPSEGLPMPSLPPTAYQTRKSGGSGKFVMRHLPEGVDETVWEAVAPMLGLP